MITPISQLTTFKNSGSVVVEIAKNIDQLKSLILKNPNETFIMGQGSNLLIQPDSSKIFIKISPLFTESLQNKGSLRVNAGLHQSKLLNLCMLNSLHGLAFIAGVPTSVGGMVAMNFGCFGKSISEFIDRVFIMDKMTGQTFWKKTVELNFKYRESIFLTNSDWIILEVVFQLYPGDPIILRNQIKEYINTRKQKQPLGQKTFGSIFKNPLGDHAGRLLEVCGFRGQQYKGVKVYENHANFLINEDHATFEDTVAFIQIIQNDVFFKTKILLEPEVRII